MKTIFSRRGGQAHRLPLAFFVALIATFATLATAAGAQRDPAAVQKARAGIQASLATGRVATQRNAVGASEKFANPNRAYPPSCLVDGLPFGIFKQNNGDPAPLQAQLTLPGDPAQCLQGGDANECNYQETVTVSVWRVPCSADSNGNGTSATLLEIDRPCGACTNTSLYPTFPLIFATQGNNSLYIRLAADPNTWYTTTYANTPLPGSDIYVLENFAGGSVQFDYNQAFSLNLDNAITFNVPAYDPNLYANASQSLPISGYMTSNWYDPQHGGEGILTQVFDNNDGATRTFTAAWYTFDQLGIPYWLYMQAAINIGARSTGTIDVYYANGGCLAGKGCGSASFTKWGTASFNFPDCSHMMFTFKGGTGSEQPSGPTTDGATLQRKWLRIANVNSIVCN